MEMKILRLSFLVLFFMISFNGNDNPKTLMNNLNNVLLSQNARFPTPVIQLQQALAQSVTQKEQWRLPEINKDLVELFQESIEKNSLPPPLPSELEELKKQLKILQLYSQQK